MIKFILSLVVAMLSIICNAQVSEIRPVANFSKIEVTSGINVIFTQGKAQPLKVEADSQQHLQKITTTVESGKLKIGLAKEHGSQTYKILNVYVQQPHVREFELNSGASIKLTNAIDEPTLALNITSGARFSGDFKSGSIAIHGDSGAAISGKISTKSLAISADSGASIKFSGKADTVTISANSGDRKSVV